jgi:hypothetical protein
MMTSVVRSFDQIDDATLARYRGDLAAFIEECLVSPYDGQPYRLNDSERAFIKYAFQLDADGRLLHTLLLYSAIKKSRKTELSGLLALAVILLLGGRYAEAFICANDREQSINRCFTACCRIVEANPLLRPLARITQDKVVFEATQSQITAIASDYASIAGGHPTISVFSELWAYTSERARRLFSELVPVPTQKISCRLVETHAGFSGEGELLYELYQRGLQLPEVDTDLHAGDGMVMHWSHRPLCHWQDEKWLGTMRRDLPPNQYLRMIENRFTSSEAAFIPMANWDACVRPELGHLPPTKHPPCFAAVDAGHKKDSTAIVLVAYDVYNVNAANKQMRLAHHVVFTPQAGAPLDFESTIETELLALSQRYQLRAIYYDPWQMVATAQRLVRRGLPMVEFPQSPANLTMATQCLFDLIQSQSILLYPDGKMRLAASRAVAVESGRGWRIDKTKQSHHIDVIVALAMAAHAASTAQPGINWDCVNDTDVDASGPQNRHQTYEEYRRARDSIKRPEWFLEAMGKKKKEDVETEKTEDELAVEAEAEANRQWRQREYFRQVLGGSTSGRVIDWSRMR